MKIDALKTLAAAVMLTSGLTLEAQVISYNIDNNGTLGNPNGSYNGTQVAGLVPVVGWHNDWNTYPTTDLTDNLGNATTLDIATSYNSGTWSANGFAQPGQDADLSWNKTLLAGYGNGTGAAGASIALSQIPYSVYDIYVYFTSDNNTRSGTVTDGATTYSFNVLDGQLAGGNALFAQTTDTGLSYPEANYAVFSGLTGTSQTISTDFGATYGGIAGFQVVAVPEPGTLTLVGLGGIALLQMTRRLKKS